MSSRLYKRLQIYGLVCSLLAVTLWLFVPHTRSQRLEGTRKHVKAQPRRSVPLQELTVSKDELRWLSNLFKKTDTTADGMLSTNELTFAIHRAVGKHIQQAMMSNPKTFFSLDKVNHNGQVEWTEWLARFYDDNNIRSEASMSRSQKERLAAAKAAWSESARSNPDALNIDEFLSFVHPESSHSALAQQMDELISRHDNDQDGIITLEEFLDDPFIEFTQDEIAQRKLQFNTRIDKDGNGRADRREIITYLDPKHSAQSKEEALRLLTLTDQDSDGYLSWREVEQNAQTFLDSKWVSPERSFHWDV